MKTSRLEKIINKTVISLTDNFTYFPCLVGQPQSIHLDFYLAEPPIWNHRTLYVSCKDRTYKTIAESMYEGLTGKHRELFDIKSSDRKTLYRVLKEKDYVRHQTWEPHWKR